MTGKGHVEGTSGVTGQVLFLDPGGGYEGLRIIS